MPYLNEEMQKKLDIYPKENNQTYTKCLIRGIEIPIDTRPEELVRQIFIHFLIKETRLFPDLINIKVEANYHDVEIYKKQSNPNFKPRQTPLIIVELKREDVNLQNHYNQIQRYLTQGSCDIGILYNYHEIILFNKKDSNFEINYLKSLKDVEKFILQRSQSVEHGLLEFEKAQNGNFESFNYLVRKFGKYTNNTVVFKLKNQQSAIGGYSFNMQENKMYYDPCGKYFKKKQSFDCQDFEKLISITY